MNKKKLIIGISIAAGLIVIAGVIYLVIQNRNLKNKIATTQSQLLSLTPTPSPLQVKTSIPAKTTTKTAEPTEVPTETPTPKTDDELILEALKNKFNSDVTMSVSKKSENAAFGGLTFVGEEAGGYFVAAKDNGEWKIIADGNGTIECSVLDQYSVPSSVVSECYDSVSQEAKTR